MFPQHHAMQYAQLEKQAKEPCRMIYQHKGMLLQNLHHKYLYILIKLPHLLDLEQRIPDFPNCDNYGSLTASNPDPLLDDTPTNDNELHLFVTLSKLTISKKWTLLSSCKTG